MKGLIQSTILIMSLSSLSFTALSATDTREVNTGPRCDPYPECQLTLNKNLQDSKDLLSDIYRFDKMLNRSH